MYYTGLLPEENPGVVSGVCSAVEIIGDNGQPLVFTERPAAHWHRPISELSNYFDTSPVIKNVSVPPSLSEMEARAGFKFKQSQAEAAARLATMNAALLHADVGTGKTLIMLGVINILRPRRVLVIAKKGLVAQWINEAAKFGSHLKAQPLTDSSNVDGGGFFVTYPAACFFPGAADKRDWACQEWDMVIFDEAHEVLGNIDTRQCRRALSFRAPYRYALTGTPYSNNIDNLFPILGWLSHIRWKSGNTSVEFPYKPWELSRFRKAFSGVERGWSGMVACGNLAALLEPFLVRLTKDDCSATSPRLTIHVHRVELEAARRQKYELLSAMREQGLKAFSSVRNMRELVLTPGANKLLPMVVRLSVVLPAVVVSPRHEITDTLIRIMDTPHGLIDGRTKDPASEAARFQKGEFGILYMGSRCAQGYSFSQCNQMIITGLEYSLASFWQTVGRVWRIDSIADAHVHIYIYKNTIEENILNRVLRRYDVAQSILGGTLPKVSIQMES